MLYYKNYSKLNLYKHKINRSTNLQLFIKIYITAVSVRWQHCIDHADKQTKAVNVDRLSSRRSSAADRQSVKRDYQPARTYMKRLTEHGHPPDPSDYHLRYPA